MLSGSRFTRQFNIHELSIGQLVYSRDSQDIRGLSWNLGVRRSISTNDKKEREHVIRSVNEILGMPLSTPGSRSYDWENEDTNFQTGIKQKRSRKKVHFVEAHHISSHSDSGNDGYPCASKDQARFVSNLRFSNDDSDDDLQNRRKARRRRKESDRNDSTDSEEHSQIKYSQNYRKSRRPFTRYEENTDTSSDSEEGRSSASRFQDYFRNSSSSESEDLKSKNKSQFINKRRPQFHGLSDTSDSEDETQIQNGRQSTLGISTMGSNSKYDRTKATSLDFYLILNKTENEHIKHCTVNFTLDIVNKNRGLKKVRKYKYQTFFPDDVSGWTNVIEWKHLTNRDNCFIDKSGWFNIEVAVIIMNTKLVVVETKPEKLETIV